MKSTARSLPTERSLPPLCVDIYDRLAGASKSPTDIQSTLKDFVQVLAQRVQPCVHDPILCGRIGDICATVDAHLWAWVELTKAGADPTRTGAVLERAYHKACRDLGELVGRGSAA
jgi:hypothetical protein